MKNIKNIKVFDENITTVLGFLTKDDIEQVEITKDINYKNILRFNITKKTDSILEKTNLLTKGNILEFVEEPRQYRISKVVKNRDARGIIQFTIQAESLFYDLNNYYKEGIDLPYSFTGTIDQLLIDLQISLKGFAWNITGDTSITVNYSNKVSYKTIILDSIKKANLLLKENGFLLTIASEVGEDNGAYFAIGKNTKGVKTRIEEDNSIYYSIDLLELQNSTDFKDKPIEFIDSFDIFDFAYINDEEMGIVNEKLRITEYIYNPFYIKDSKIQMNDLIPDFTQNVVTVQTLAQDINKVQEDGEVVNVDNAQYAEEAGNATNAVNAQNALKADEAYLLTTDGDATNQVYFDATNNELVVYSQNILTARFGLNTLLTNASVMQLFANNTIDLEVDASGKIGLYAGDFLIEIIDGTSIRISSGIGAYTNEIYMDTDNIEVNTNGTFLYNGNEVATV